MTTVDAAQLAERDPVVILPLAAIEQHGPHLPLSTDLDIGMGLLARAFEHLPDAFPAWVLPPQPVGASREHARFAGTLTLEPQMLASLIVEHGVALSRCGVRRLVISNSHGGNRSAVESAGLRLRAEQGLLVVDASYFRFARPDDIDWPSREWRHGLHGGALETAMMLYLRPDLVRAVEARGAPSLAAELEEHLRRIGPSGEASFAWLAGDLNSSGVVGDAGLADAATGERLVAYYGERLAEVIRDAKDFPLARLT